MLKLKLTARDVVESRVQTVTSQTPVLLPPGGLSAFVKRGKNLYEATRLRPEKSLVGQWKSSGKRTVDKRLRDLHLGQNFITNLRLCMMGPEPDGKRMRPTIFIVCSDENTIKRVENDLRGFINVSFPDSVDLKVVTGRLRLASGPRRSLPSKRGEKMNLSVGVMAGGLQTLVGKRSSVFESAANHPPCTIGGMISIGNSLYGLTVAHSMFEDIPVPPILDQPDLLMPCGWVDSYEWSGNYRSGDPEADANRSSGSLATERDSRIAMDWMLIRLHSDYILPNRFMSSHYKTVHEITGFLSTADFSDDEVWVCSGFSRPQMGILDTTPSTIILGQVSYDVFSIFFEGALGM
jgi:hypothetical protein